MCQQGEQPTDLESAILARKKGHYKAAIDSLKRIVENKQGNEQVWLEKIVNYLSLGRSREALSVADRALAKYPQSRDILENSYRAAVVMNDWRVALKYCRALICVDADEPRYYAYEGKSLLECGEWRNAARSFEMAVSKLFGGDISDAIREFERKLEPTLGKVTKTTFQLVAGKNNLGSFIHSAGGRKYFTKISLASLASEREAEFYKSLASKVPALQRFTPAYIYHERMGSFFFLTLGMVEGERIESDDIQVVLDAMSLFQSIRVRDFGDVTPPSRSSNMAKRSGYLYKFFSEIHKSSTNRTLFRKMREVLKNNDYPKDIVTMVGELEHLFVGKHLYTLVDPKKHYGLFHSDLTNPNILRNDDQVYVLDWGAYSEGLSIADLARFMSINKLDFFELQQTEKMHGMLAPRYLIEVLYFYLAFLFSWILDVKVSELNSIRLNVIYPTLNAIYREVQGAGLLASVPSLMLSANAGSGRCVTCGNYQGTTS